MKNLFIVVVILALFSCQPKSKNDKEQSIKEVTADTFIRAETDNMYTQMIKNAGGTNQFFHFRTPTPLDNQTVIRMNRDVLYSGGVFDSKDGLEITFPEMPDSRYASIYILDNDHYVQDIFYKSGNYIVKGNTRFLYIIVRIQVFNAKDASEIEMVNDLQNQFMVTSISNQPFPDFEWDTNSLDSLRNVYNKESANYASWKGMMGKRGTVDEETRHIAAAAAWGLLPEEAATYLNYKPQKSSKDKCYTATYLVPDNDGFWSITVYGDDGYIKTENCLLNGSNVVLNNDNTFTVHYGSEEVCGDAPNRLDAPNGWNILFRIYRPGESVLNGSFTLPEVE
ncbi:DUF1254 domain-containing protein [Flagellimonas zhangzhouensis]|uniref:DUF1254 domain-containing protein n=1 Tax=Flagellimonas zhangzhouensis TaxID=1073328 RepID=A0A1H2QXF0_9FLAO|nr:DUF1254 domain-containing protein [Allomuricauda zhangzhouensis]SDQ57109.1 Protein of unknown function [Allomuricauda zhangzhouensis]SDW11129.1 Protein of unknown function [Allomuricauda zhangzhouensis]